MDTEWGPDVFDSKYVERVQPMTFEKYARVPKEFSAQKDSKDKRLMLDPLWAWQGFFPDENGLTQAGFDNNDFQLFESYDYNTMDKIRSDYGSARNVFTKISGQTLKRNIEALYIEELLNMARPEMSPKELHEGAIDKAAEEYLDKGFNSYLKKKNMICTEKMKSIMHDIAKQVHIFDYSRNEDRFSVMKGHIFAEASHAILPVIQA